MSQSLIDEKKYFPENSDGLPRSLIKKLCFGKTAIPDWEPIKKSKNSTVRFATIVGDFLQESLDFEGEQFFLTHNSWRNIIQFAKIDFLLIESTWEDCTGDWNLAQHPSSDKYEELLLILSEAKKKGIPTVYWQTAGKEYHEIYASFAKNFDVIFCAEKEEIDLFASEGIIAEYLPPCIQPSLQNPFKHYDYYDTINWGIVYDGWKDLERKPELWNIISEFTNMDLHIIESNAVLFINSIFAKTKQLPDYAQYLYGCVTKSQRRTLLKYAKIHITLSEGLTSSCKQRWLTLEAAACGCLPLYHGSFVEDDICQGIARECDKTDWLLLELERCRQDPWYQKRLAHLAWRKVNMEHTFSHRVRTICQHLGITHDWIEYPLISMITPTYRKENLEFVINICANQTYPNKEHIIITNGFQVPKEEQQFNEKYSLKYLSIPEENFAGPCLNIGFQQANGEYVYRIDDDDTYGCNYILDTILHNRAFDISFWGKTFKYIQDDTKIIKMRCDKKIYANCIYNPQKHNCFPSGCSFAGKKDFFQVYNFSNQLFGATDSAFQYNLKTMTHCILLDEFNMIIYRSKDLSKHTWKITSIPVAEETLFFKEPII